MSGVSRLPHWIHFWVMVFWPASFRSFARRPVIRVFPMSVSVPAMKIVVIFSFYLFIFGISKCRFDGSL